MSFDHALDFVLRWEGGFSNHPRDPGGATNLGITQRTLDDARGRHPDWRLPLDVRYLKRDQAGLIYKADYWDAIRGDDLPAGVGLLLFDAAVNHGPLRAVRWLQQAAETSVDGVIGPKTLAAVQAELPLTLIREIGLLRAFGYIGTGNMAVFGQGWMRRLFGAVVEASRLSGE